jgi:peptidoglycan/xylan/chitin deacetylase (PgdA/CDA1 family)
MKFTSLQLLSLILLGCTFKNATHSRENPCKYYSCDQGGVVRGDTNKRALAIVFTGGDYADGGEHIINVLKSHETQASFFFTGDFYRKSDFRPIIQQLVQDGHYLGAHSDRHLLYCDWGNRDSLLVTKNEFIHDLEANYKEMEKYGISPEEAIYFMPPYEWYNDSISHWTRDAGFQLINFTPGTRSNADYTTPDMPNYRSSAEIFRSIVDFEESSNSGLKGFILLVHIGTAPERTDKFYHRLDDLILWLQGEGYELKRIDELLKLG